MKLFVPRLRKLADEHRDVTLDLELKRSGKKHEYDNGCFISISGSDVRFHRRISLT